MPRRLDAETLGIAEAVEEARKRVREKHRATRGAYDSSYDVRDNLENVAAIYAAQSYEIEVELPFATPENSEESKPYGLLTYTLCQVIHSTNSSRPLTYRELTQRVRLQYVRMGRMYPTPSVEGKNADKEVLGVKEWPRRERFVLQRTPGTWTASAGKVHGLTDGSILAVYSDSADEQPDGYVRIEKADVLSSRVTPCQYKDAVIVDNLPSPAHCEPVFVNFEDLRLKLLAESIDDQEVKRRGRLRDGDRRRRRRERENEREANRRQAAPVRVVQTLKKLAANKDSLIEIVTHPTPNCWRVEIEADEFFLVPPQGEIHGLNAESLIVGPGKVAELESELENWLKRRARVELLKRLARPAEAELVRGWGSEAIDVRVEVVKYEGPEDRKGVSDQGGPEGITLNEGEIVGFQVTNQSQRANVYVTLLFIDGQYGVTSIYPGLGEIAERLPPRESFRTTRFRVNVETAGNEHVLAIALKATGPPVDFTSLEQPTIERARPISITRSVSGNDPLDSPLGKLMQYGLYAKGNTRGLSRMEIDDHVIDLMTWKTLTKEPKPDEQ